MEIGLKGMGIFTVKRIALSDYHFPSHPDFQVASKRWTSTFFFLKYFFCISIQQLFYSRSIEIFQHVAALEVFRIGDYLFIDTRFLCCMERSFLLTFFLQRVYLFSHPAHFKVLYFDIYLALQSIGIRQPALPIVIYNITFVHQQPQRTPTSHTTGQLIPIILTWQADHTIFKPDN